MTQEGDRSREELTREAEEARARLLRTVEQLDDRRREATEVGLQLKRHVGLLLAGGLAVVLASAWLALRVARRVEDVLHEHRRPRWRRAMGRLRHALRGHDWRATAR
jgi:hypothetical protein